MRFAFFPVHLSKLLRLPRKSDAMSYEVLHLSRKIFSANLEASFQPPLRKSAPGPRNSSDEHVSCTAPATENASLQVLFKCPTPAIVFGNATKPSRFCSLLTRSTIPCACHAKRHLNVQKWREHVRWLRNVLRATTACTFLTSQLLKVVRSWRGNVLRATTACTFSTSQLPKVLRTWGVFSFFTCKHASPQRRALFRHRNF